MTILNAIEMANSLRKRLVDFSCDDSFTSQTQINEIVRSIWSSSAENGGLVSDIWVEGSFPAKSSGTTLQDLVVGGQFSSDLVALLDKNGAVPSDRELYTHQLESIKAANMDGVKGDRPGVVITSGTGSGKTEAFLLPILNELFDETPEEGEGVSCIILYPMNALVNDQIDRLYSWLSGQENIRLFHFTGETPENAAAAERRAIGVWDKCRLRTRQEARGLEHRDGTPLEPNERGRVPNILITNYSMLEYMLVRPQDGIFFGKNLKAVVLDEAHLYTGTLAGEISLLLRRLMLRCNLTSNDVLQMASSATLGSGETSPLQEFASRLLTKDESSIKVVQGSSAPVILSTPIDPETVPTPSSINAAGNWIDEPTLVLDKEGGTGLAKSPGLCQKLEDQLPVLSSTDLSKYFDEKTEPAKLIHGVLKRINIVHRLVDILWNRNQIALQDLAQELFQSQDSESLQATLTLLNLTSSARQNPQDYPLVPHKIHLMVRPVDDISICLNRQCNGQSEIKYRPLGSVLTGKPDRCPHCLSQCLSLSRCERCGSVNLLAEKSQHGLEQMDNTRRTTESSGCYSFTENASSDITVDVENGRFNAPGEKGTVNLTELEECSVCAESTIFAVPFSTGSALALGIITETVLSELNELPVANNIQNWLPGGGRRLISFSDSRRDSARLAPLINNSHEAQVVRAAIMDAGNQEADEDLLNFLIGQRSDQQKILEENQPKVIQEQIESEINRFDLLIANMQEGGSISKWTKDVQDGAVIEQLLDIPTSYSHKANLTEQRLWERNAKSIKGTVRDLLAKEFARVENRNTGDLESLGLIEVGYPGSGNISPTPKLLAAIPTEAVRKNVSSNWESFILYVLDSLRTDNCITVEEDIDSSLMRGNIPIGKWAIKGDSAFTSLVRFIGVTSRQRRMKFAVQFLNACGADSHESEQLAPLILEDVFDGLYLAGETGQFEWLESSKRQPRHGDGGVDAIRLRLAGLTLKKMGHAYESSLTKFLYPRETLGTAFDLSDNEKLVRKSSEELDTNPRFGRQRRELRGSPIFRMGIWAEEHSAQLSSDENRRRQELFKKGQRNLLSSTTTMELGIDIGSLNAVQMNNVPPGKANYLQRSGRAGRRADGTSIVITYAMARSYDREVFQRIGDYLAKPLRDPIVFLSRDRIVRRHIHSWLLGEFFRSYRNSDIHVGAMDAFGRMGAFCQVSETPHWPANQNIKPVIQEPYNSASRPPDPVPDWWDLSKTDISLADRYVDYLGWLAQNIFKIEKDLNQIVNGTPLEDQDIYELIIEAVDNFEGAVSDWKDDISRSTETWEDIESNPLNRRFANSLAYQQRNLYRKHVISTLAQAQHIPSYGFPIDVNSLKVYDNKSDQDPFIREDESINLSRQGAMSISEYAPGRPVYVMGRTEISRGIMKHWTGANIPDEAFGESRNFAECNFGHFSHWVGEQDKCDVCGTSIQGSVGQLLIPSHGFSTQAQGRSQSDPPGSQHKIESLTTSFQEEFLSTQPKTFLPGFSNVVYHYRGDGELFVLNRGLKVVGFAICSKCGYSDSESTLATGFSDLPSGFIEHVGLNDTRRRKFPVHCLDGNSAGPPLRNRTLAARTITDMLTLDLSSIDVKHISSPNIVLTVSLALRRSAAELLQLDSREIGALVVPMTQGTYAPLIYDDVPGGAGHVAQLFNDESISKEWISRANDILYGGEKHHATCLKSCIDCVLSFETQSFQNLNRPAAYKCLTEMIELSQQGI